MPSKHPKKLGLTWQGNLFKSSRDMHGLSQQRLSEYLGSDVNYISWWENEVLECPQNKIDKLLDLCAVDAEIYDRLKLLMDAINAENGNRNGILLLNCAIKKLLKDNN